MAAKGCIALWVQVFRAHRALHPSMLSAIAIPWLPRGAGDHTPFPQDTLTPSPPLASFVCALPSLCCTGLLHPSASVPHCSITVGGEERALLGRLVTGLKVPGMIAWPWCPGCSQASRSPPCTNTMAMRSYHHLGCMKMPQAMYRSLPPSVLSSPRTPAHADVAPAARERVLSQGQLRGALKMPDVATLQPYTTHLCVYVTLCNVLIKPVPVTCLLVRPLPCHFCSLAMSGCNRECS